MKLDNTTLEILVWPIVVLIIAPFFLWVFRKPLSSLILRIKSIGTVNTFEPRPQKEEKNKEAVQELLNVGGGSVILNEIESTIRQELKDRDIDTDMNKDTINILIKHLAATQLILDFEQIYSMIFGSQIRLLQKLNQSVNRGIQIEELQSYFEQTQKNFPQPLSTWSLDGYLKFLIGRYLIVAKGNSYCLTDKGVEYLSWMTNKGKFENKPI